MIIRVWGVDQMKRLSMVFLTGLVFIVAGVAQTPVLQWGNATWYETDSKGMFASHATLPFGTRVRITNMENNKWVVVTISNRIPKREDLLIYVAQMPAQDLGMLEADKTPVIIEVVRRGHFGTSVSAASSRGDRRN